MTYHYDDGLDEERQAFAATTDALFLRASRFLTISINKVEKRRVYMHVRKSFPAALQSVEFLFFIDGILHYATTRKVTGDQLDLELVIQERFLPLANVQRMKISCIGLTVDNTAVIDHAYYVFNADGVKPLLDLRSYMFPEFA